MKFSRHDTHGVRTEIEIHDDSTLDEVLEEFQNFLRACGYAIEYDKRLVLETVE